MEKKRLEKGDDDDDDDGVEDDVDGVTAASGGSPEVACAFFATGERPASSATIASTVTPHSSIDFCKLAKTFASTLFSAPTDGGESGNGEDVNEDDTAIFAAESVAVAEYNGGGDNDGADVGVTPACCMLWMSGCEIVASMAASVRISAVVSV